MCPLGPRLTSLMLSPSFQLDMMGLVHLQDLWVNIPAEFFELILRGCGCWRLANRRLEHLGPSSTDSGSVDPLTPNPPQALVLWPAR
eukprot:182056-Pyramimonas_sp.AAC.1